MKSKPIVCAILMIALILVSACTNLPLRRSEVKAVIARNRWELKFDWKGTNNTLTEIRGTRIIFAYLGGYQGLPWHADVDAYWGFDENGKLIDLNVRKHYDAL